MYLVDTATCLLQKNRSVLKPLLSLDVLSGTVGKKPKLYSQETKHLFSDAPSTPKKLFDSDEKKEEIQIGKASLFSKVKCLSVSSCSFLVVEISHVEACREVYGGRVSSPKGKM